MPQLKKIFHPYCLKLLLLCTASVLLFTYGNAQRPKAGGGKKAAPVSRASAGNTSRPTGNAGRPSNTGAGGNRNTISNSGNRDIKTGNKGGIGNNSNIGNKNNTGNKVNVDNSRRNVNINVDNSKNFRVNNSHNTVVRRSNNFRPYARPPYRYGGFRYNCYHPYFYHPFHPFVWGPMWHPWGFFVVTIATTAIILSVHNDAVVPPNNDLVMTPVFDNSYYAPAMETAFPVTAAVFSPDEQYGLAAASAAVNFSEKQQYYYDAGVYYIKADGGYTVVAAPVGATIKTLPEGYETVKTDDATNYYYGGAFYEKTSSGYKVVPPTAGAVVEHISEGGEEVKMGETTYVKLGDTYYQPIQQDGKSVYEVADVEEDK